MKQLTLICLLAISLTLVSSSAVSHMGREFLTGYFKTVNGKDFELKKECMGPEFDEDLTKLFKAIDKENIILLGALVQKMMNDTKKNCGDSEALAVIQDVEHLIKSGKLLSNIITNSQEIVHILREEVHSSNKDAHALGQFLGKLTNVVVYNKHQNGALTFLGTEGLTGFPVDGIEHFVQGIFEGISSVPFEQNKCDEDAEGFKPHIVDAFRTLVVAIKKRENIIAALMKFTQLFEEIKDLEANCHFKQLAFDLGTLATSVGEAKVVYRLVTHPSAVLSSVADIGYGIRNQEAKRAGKGFGEFIKIALNYSTI